MSSDKKLDPTGERAEATEAMETTPISGKEHEYQADGDHHPRQKAEAEDRAKSGAGGGGGGAGAKVGVAADVGVETERHISEGIPGAGQSQDDDAQRRQRHR